MGAELLTDIAVSLDLLLVIFTLLYLGMVLIGVTFDIPGRYVIDGFFGNTGLKGSIEKRSLLHQQVKRRVICRVFTPDLL